MRLRTLLGLIVVCLCACPIARAQDIVLRQDTNIVIEAEGRMDNAGPVLKNLLAKYLLRALKKEKLDGEGGTVRFVIRANAVDWSHMGRDRMSDLSRIDAFDIHTSEAEDNTICITGETVLATGYGILHFLERYLGVVWAFPGELGICMPERNEYRLKIERESVAPVFMSRFHSGIVDYSPEYARNPSEGIVHRHRGFFRADDCIKSLRLRILNTVNHNMIQIFPVKESKEKHPEIFPIKNGKRYIPSESSQTWHPCYTNAKTIEIATRKALAHYESGGISFSMGVNDGRKVQCECDECRKLGFPESYYHFVIQVAESVKDHYPPHTVGVLAYGDVAEPPEDLVLPDNVVVYASGSLAISKDGGEHLMRWGKHAKHLSVYEYLCGDHYWFPNFQFKIMQGNIEFFRKANVKYYWAMTYPMWPFDGPKMYINTRLLWERDVDIDAALEHYCAAAFGRGAKPMADFYRRWASVRDRDLVPDGVSPTWSYAEYRRPDVQFGRCSSEDFQFAAECLERAKQAAQDPNAQDRIEMVAAFFEYGRTLFHAVHLRRQVFEYTEKKDWHKLASEAITLWTRRQQLIETFRNHPEWFEGTRCTLDWILSKAWEDDERWTINYELPNAVRTALFHVKKQVAARQADAKTVPPDFRIVLNPHQSQPVSFRSVVEKYGYYHKDLYNLMVSSPSETGLSFKADPDVSWKVPQDAELKDYWGNGMKKAVFAGRVKMERAAYYLFSFDVTGREGTLMLRVMNLDAGGKMVRLEDPFKGPPQRLRKQMLLKPKPRNGGSDPSWNVELIFTPDSENADFAGTCTVTRVDFKTDKAR